MKKTAILLAVLLMLASLAGCAPAASDAPAAQAPQGEQPAAQAEPAQSGEEVYIDIWGLWQVDNYRGEWMQTKANEYAAQHPGVTIEYIYQNSYNGVAEKLTAGAMSGELPVLAQMEESFITRFHPICLNFDDYMTAEEIANFNDGLMVNGKWEGKTLAIPSNRSVPVLYLNLDILNEAGLDPAGPNTWDDLYAYAKAIKEKTGKYGFAIFFDDDAWIWESALYSWGGQVVSDDGKTVTFGENYAGANVIALYEQMVSEEVAFEAFSTGETITDANQSRFINGEVGMYIGSCGIYGNLAANCEFPVQVCYMPEGTTRSVVTGGANWILPQGSSDAQIEHAIGFLKYITSDENCLEWMQVSGYMPATKSAAQSEAMLALFEEDPNYKVIIDELQFAHKRPNTASWREMYTYIVEKLVDAMLHPETDAKAIIDDCVTKCQAILDANA